MKKEKLFFDKISLEIFWYFDLVTTGYDYDMAVFLK